MVLNNGKCIFLPFFSSRRLENLPDFPFNLFLVIITIFCFYSMEFLENSAVFYIFWLTSFELFCIFLIGGWLKTEQPERVLPLRCFILLGLEKRLVVRSTLVTQKKNVKITWRTQFENFFQFNFWSHFFPFSPVFFILVSHLPLSLWCCNSVVQSFTGQYDSSSVC